MTSRFEFRRIAGWNAFFLACVASLGHAAELPTDNAALAAKSRAAFGEQKGQSFDARAFIAGTTPLRTDTMSVTLAPGKGAEIMAAMSAGQSFVFQWSATADVAVDMHGERPDAGEKYTTFSIDGGQRQASGVLTAPYDGHHGWYWQNLGKTPVTVTVSVTGFHTKLFKPEH